MSTKPTPSKPPQHWRADLPDSDISVLIRVDDGEYPIMLGFHDGEAWRGDDAGLIRLPIVGWLHLEDAAVLIDGVLPRP